MIIFANGDSKVKWPKCDSHDPDEEKLYNLHYRAPTRIDSTSYKKDVDFIILPTDNGCMYVCTSGGISAAAIGSFKTVEGEFTEDGDVTWKCIPLGSLLGFGDTISASAWTADTGVTITGPLIYGSIETEIKVTDVPDGINSFELTNTCDILYSTGKTEKRQRTIVVTVKEL